MFSIDKPPENGKYKKNQPVQQCQVQNHVLVQKVQVPKTNQNPMWSGGEDNHSP